MSDENRPGRRQPPDGGQAGRNGAAPPDAVLHPVDSHTLRRAGILWFVMIAAFVYLLVRIRPAGTRSTRTRCSVSSPPSRR